jgi:hypothetical protein
MIRCQLTLTADHFYTKASEVNGSFTGGLSKRVSFKYSQNRK